MDGSKGIEDLLGTYIRQSPRAAGALAFGVFTLVVQHLVWYPDARMSGLAPALTIAVGLCHAVAGGISGPRLVDAARTSSALRAALTGAVTSLLALALFAFVFTVYLFATDVRPAGMLSYAIFPFLIALFAFLADGWVLLLLSSAVGWALYRLSNSQGAAGGLGS